MKRSDMIKKLTELIDIVGINLHLFESEASAILDRIGALGMVPPFSLKNISEIEIGGDFEWDDEDET